MELLKNGPRREPCVPSPTFLARLRERGRDRKVVIFTASGTVFVGRLLAADEVSLRLATESRTLRQAALEVDTRLVEAVEIVG